MLGREASISGFLLSWLREERLPSSEQQILRKYYASYCSSFSERMCRQYEGQTIELMDLIHSMSAPRVLEVGCGCGTESLWMAIQGAEVHAIDVRADRLRVAKERLRVLENEIEGSIKCTFEQVSVLELLEDSSFDIVWMEQTLHHLEPRQEIFDKLSRLPRVEGYVVISEANGLNPLLQLSLFAKRGFKTIKTYSDEMGRKRLYGNERVLSLFSLRRSLEKRGIQTVGARHFRLFPNHWIFNHAEWLEEAAPRWCYPMFTHFNYIGKRTPG